MNEALKQFTADLAKELQKKLEAPEIREFVAAVKASGDDRSFEVVMSTSDEDRQGDSLDQSRWDFKYFDMNPVVLFAHDYSSFPIGIVTDIEVKGDKAVATGKFAPAGVNPAADMACALYQQKILRAVSPGYIQNDDGTRELLEVSFCPVPAGRYALSLRQQSSLGVSTRDLVAKGFFYEAKETKAPQAGDSCQTEDGEPGTLTEDDDNPGTLICVPSEAKANKSNENQGDMNDELIKAIGAEHGRHGEAVAKAIDDFSGKCFGKDGETPNDTTKEIAEFGKAIDGENAEHLEKCMKAIDDNYELQDQKKSLDEFKSAMRGEHMKHVECFDKSIDEFKSAWADGDDSDRAKAVEDFTKSAGSELERHKEAHMEMCKAEMGEGETEEQKAARIAAEAGKPASAVPAAVQEKINAIVRSLEDRLSLIREHEKAITDAIASLKELTGPPQEDEGAKPEEKSGAAPKPKVESSKIRAKDEAELSEFEAYMLVRRILKAVYQASGEGLERIKKELRKDFPDRR